MTQEKTIHALSGWLILPCVLVGYICGLYHIAAYICKHTNEFGSLVLPYLLDPADISTVFISILLILLAFTLQCGLFSLEPGKAKVLVLFGAYKGTVKRDGFFFVNPFCSKKSISLRARTLNGEHLKVNDKMGNPIEIATVIVWHVSDTARALFDVDAYDNYVALQTETALRHVASLYAYDHMEDDDAKNTQITLRANIEEISVRLKQELDNKLSAAGVSVDDARLTHLAYAPEIAQAMLRRQQAEAIIAARKKIVEGAVSMVDMALEKLSQEQIVELDDEKKAAMASNLMIVLCGESETQPVINTGTLYQ